MRRLKTSEGGTVGVAGGTVILGGVGLRNEGPLEQGAEELFPH